MESDLKEQDFDCVFRPASIALFGVAPSPTNWGGQIWPGALLDLGFRGALYPVSSRASEVCGLKAYPSIKDIPGTVDYVICCIAAEYTPQLMRECISKGVRVVHLFTSGFSEVEGEEGLRLEAEIVRIARGGGIRVIGPNCPGVYCPESGLSFGFGLPKEVGRVAGIFQSGGHCIRFVQLAAGRGIRFSKVIACGNCCGLNETDFLEYLAHDPDTDIIACYIEGVRDAGRFFKVLKEAAELKPVIIHKGGHTDAGTRAAASHTGALTGADEVWEAVCRQSHIIRVYNVDELVDVVLAFHFMLPPKGRNVGIIGGGGGASVQAADDCESAGLRVPLLPRQIRDELRQFTPAPNNILKNPIDTQWLMWDTSKFAETVRLVSRWEGVDFVLTPIWTDMFPLSEMGNLLDVMVEAVLASREVCLKPMAAMIDPGTSAEAAASAALARERLASAGLAVYPSVARAAAAINRFIQHMEFRGSPEHPDPQSRLRWPKTGTRPI